MQAGSALLPTVVPASVSSPTLTVMLNGGVNLQVVDRGKKEEGESSSESLRAVVARSGLTQLGGCWCGSMQEHAENWGLSYLGMRAD